MRSFKTLLLVLSFCFLSHAFALINVPIAVLEASYMPVYTDSERNSLIFSMPIALQRYGKKAMSCGYKYSFLFSEFAYGNPESTNSATKYILSNHPWAIWGPETNDELDQAKPFLEKSAPTQFSSFTFEDVYNNKNIISISNNQKDEIDVLFKTIGDLNNIGIVYDSSCNMCNIYLNSISKNNSKSNFKYYQLSKESEILGIKSRVIKDKIKSLIILLYGDTTGKFISHFEENKDITFYGTKMFGNEVSSEMMKYNVSGANILLVRPLPPENFDSIYFNIQDENKDHRVFDNSFYMLYFVKKYTELLCKYRPSDEIKMREIIQDNRSKFKYIPKYQILKSNGKNLFIYKNIENGNARKNR